MLELEADTLIVFVSDSHIGGDPGCDGFESAEELEALFGELAGREEPVELVLAGDFFDFLQIGTVPEGVDRAALTMARPEYLAMFGALARFRSGEGNRVIYLPGNHDAESFWNPAIQETLEERGLVDEFAYRYLASIGSESKRWVIYCEHGNQLDPANTVENYHDPLDTPLGHHVVTDFTRRVAPFGEVFSGLDLSEIKMVYPLVAIPNWVVGRYAYAFAGKMATYLFLPLLIAYLVYRISTFFVARSRGERVGILGNAAELPWAHFFFVDTMIFLLVILLIFAVFLLLMRRVVRRALVRVSIGEKPSYSPAQASENRVREILRAEARPPMSPDLDPTTVDVFVWGHTHLPSLGEEDRPGGGRAVLTNSGCWLRQLQPVTPHLKGPPVFVSKFVLTHVRVYVRDGSLRVELWEQPKPAEQRLSRLERLLSWGRRPTQPSANAKPRLQAFADL